MTVKVNIDSNRLQKELIQNYLRKVNHAVDVLKTEIDRLTPEDTKNLLQNNRVKPAVLIGDKVVGSVYNETDYAFFVEYWVGWNAYNYHKPKGNTFYRGIGNRTFTRSLDTIRQDLNKILEQW